MYGTINTFCVDASRITGVGHCIVYSCIGLSTTFLEINGNHLHTFCFYTNPPHRRCYGIRLLTMEKLNYIAPDIEVIDVAVEQGFAQSNTLEGINRNEPLDWESL